MFTIKRSSHNPILSPIRENSWESAASFNPSPAEYKKKKYLVYRALSEPDPLVGPNLRISTVAVASSSDGVHYDKRSILIDADTEYDRYGAEVELQSSVVSITFFTLHLGAFLSESRTLRLL
jgi:predicted GH43/DUF377 family glycosyl hydrolase